MIAFMLFATAERTRIKVTHTHTLLALHYVEFKTG